MSQAGHSEEYFGDYRDLWWNADFVDLIAERLNLASKQSVLEVGCGLGHWTRTIAPHLPPGATINCVDTDPKWLRNATTWAAAPSNGDVTIDVGYGDALSLPFADARFDFMTCQTVLIHVSDPLRAIREMLRVLKPGGSLLCVEPDNLCSLAMRSSFGDALTPAESAQDFEFALAVERGRRALGRGDHSLGGLVPGYLNQVGFERIRTWLSDKAIPLYPQYEQAEQRTVVADMKAWRHTDDAHKQESLRYFLAGGEDSARFDTLWTTCVENQARYKAAVDAGTVTLGGAALMFLVSGVKPVNLN